MLVVWKTILFFFFFFLPHGCLNSVEINSFCAAKLPIETLFGFNKSFSPEQFPGEEGGTHAMFTLSLPSASTPEGQVSLLS